MKGFAYYIINQAWYCDTKSMLIIGFVRKNSSQCCFPYAKSIDQHDKLREKYALIRSSR